MGGNSSKKVCTIYTRWLVRTSWLSQHTSKRSKIVPRSHCMRLLRLFHCTRHICLRHLDGPVLLVLRTVTATVQLILEVQRVVVLLQAALHVACCVPRFADEVKRIRKVGLPCDVDAITIRPRVQRRQQWLAHAAVYY